MATLAFGAHSRRDHGDHVASFPGGTKGILGAFKSVYGSFTLDTNYPDHGYTEATLLALPGLAAYGFTKIICIIPVSGAIAVDKFYPGGWDGDNKTLVFGGADGVEAATGLDALDGCIFHCIVVGH